MKTIITVFLVAVSLVFLVTCDIESSFTDLISDKINDDLDTGGSDDSDDTGDEDDDGDPPDDPTWNILTLDSSASVGRYTSLVLDSDDYPHISYYDDDNVHLKYIYKTSSGWENYDTIDNDGDVGQYSSIALNSNGNPCIGYYDAGNDSLKYAEFNGTAWDIEVVDDGATPYNVGRWTSLAMDGDIPHLIYFDSDTLDLKYAKWDDGSSAWDIEFVDAGTLLGPYNSLCIDSGGIPHISFSYRSNYSLGYAHRNGGSWTVDPVDTTNGSGYYTSIILETDNKPHISIQDGLNDNLMYIHWDDDESKWNGQVNTDGPDTVDSTDVTGLYTSIALDADGNPHISYYDDTNNDLRYAYWNGSSWKTETVDSAGNMGSHTSIDLDSNGHAHISYYDATNESLKYAYRLK